LVAGIVFVECEELGDLVLPPPISRQYGHVFALPSKWCRQRALSDGLAITQTVCAMRRKSFATPRL
jgi:hypothetical protein